LQFNVRRGKYFVRSYLEKFFTKIGPVEWLKVKALSSNPSTAKKKRHRNQGREKVQPAALKKKNRIHQKEDEMPFKGSMSRLQNRAPQT
jgi:hypothetical protein